MQLGAGTRALQEDHEFDDNLGPALEDYTSSVVDMELDVNSTARATTKRSDRGAALELKNIVSDGSTFDLEAALQDIEVDARDRIGRTALSYAAEWGKYDAAKALLDGGASVFTRVWNLTGSDDGHNPEFSCGATPLWWAAWRSQASIVDLLLRRGANPNSRTTAGRSPLQDSCWEGDIASARLLLDKGADVNAQDVIVSVLFSRYFALSFFEAMILIETLEIGLVTGPRNHSS